MEGRSDFAEKLDEKIYPRKIRPESFREVGPFLWIILLRQYVELVLLKIFAYLPMDASQIVRDIGEQHGFPRRSDWDRWASAVSRPHLSQALSDKVGNIGEVVHVECGLIFRCRPSRRAASFLVLPPKRLPSEIIQPRGIGADRREQFHSENSVGICRDFAECLQLACRP